MYGPLFQVHECNIHIKGQQLDRDSTNIVITVLRFSKDIKPVTRHKCIYFFGHFVT